MSTEGTVLDLDTSRIKTWRSIVTLVVFVLANIVVLFPFHIPIYLPRILSNAIQDALSALRIISPRQTHSHHDNPEQVDEHHKLSYFVKLSFPMNFVTGPLIADLFLLAILAIGREEVYGGTVGSDGISPIDIMVFFITLAYIAISIDASGLIRYLAFKVLQKAGKVGHRLFFFLYAFFFLLGSFIGNDPIILSGTAFLAYMTRVSSNIIHPRAWIYTQFAIANIASAILVSSNPTNLVLASAFKVKFIVYTANMIVPVVFTAIVLFPFLLYIVFADEALIPLSIKMHELSEEAKAKKPVNPNIPNARANIEEQESEHLNDDQGKLLSLEEIMNPFVDKGGAAFGAFVMAATVITLLAVNASAQSNGEHPVFWVTLPAAFIMFSWDLTFGWLHRHETRELARQGREALEKARAARALREETEREPSNEEERNTSTDSQDPQQRKSETSAGISHTNTDEIMPLADNTSSRATTGLVPQDGESTSHLLSSQPEMNPTQAPTENHSQNGDALPGALSKLDEKHEITSTLPQQGVLQPATNYEKDEKAQVFTNQISHDTTHQNHATLVSKIAGAYTWAQETFPTVTAVASHLPFALVPFAFSVFILVQALVTKGWVPVFAYGWDHWVKKTGTVGAIGGMGFLSVILCNFSGTNIGTTILLSRVIQSWQAIHALPAASAISDRTFWATVYSMAIGVNYGAFSTTFSASLAGLLWRDILARKHIRVRSLEFASVNLPIIAIAMAVGCTVLVGEVYIVRGTGPYKGGGVGAGE